MSLSGLGTNTESFLYAVSYAYSTNGIQILLAGFLNHSSAVIVQRLFFYATHQCFGTLAYVSGAMMLVSDEDNLTMAGMISMVVGACHFFHLIHLFFKIYV
ncbi:uncharacterized protein LOC144107942 isoform X2 [Amblyomma americanum]